MQNWAEIPQFFLEI